MKKNNTLKITLVAVAVIALAFAFFSPTNSTGKFTGNQIASSDSSTGTTNFGSLDVTSFTALLKGEKYTCNKEGGVSEEARACNDKSPCPSGSGYCGSSGYCSLCTDKDGKVITQIRSSAACYGGGFGESITPGA